MAIGMAGTDLKSVMPVKPDVLLDPADAKFLDQD
jgi:hypothetical protein